MNQTDNKTGERSGVIIVVCGGCPGVSIRDAEELTGALGTLARIAGAKTYEWHSVDFEVSERWKLALLSGEIGNLAQKYRKG